MLVGAPGGIWRISFREPDIPEREQTPRLCTTGGIAPPPAVCLFTLAGRKASYFQHIIHSRSEAAAPCPAGAGAELKLCGQGLNRVLVFVLQDEVQHRRDEFARLLDEHEQVVRELRRIESSSELQTLAEMGSSRADEAASSFLHLASTDHKHQEE